MKLILWLIHASLSLVIAPLNWLRNRIENGPSAHLWLASDEDIMAEAKRRGLLKRQRKAQSVGQVQSEVQIDPALQDAIKAVATLNGVLVAKARDVVVQAAREFSKRGQRPETQELTVLALKMVG